MSSPNNRVINQPVTSRGRRTRQRILDTAEEVFGEKGYDRASIAEITQKAKVAQGTFYIYFPDKKAAFIELVKELNRLVRRECASATAGITDRVEAEQVGFNAFFNFVLKRRHLFRIIFQAEFVDEEIHRWYYRSFAEGYMRGLKKAMETGQIRSLDPECLAYCLMGAAQFLGMRWCLWEHRLPPKEALDSVVSFVKQGIVASGNK